MTKRRFYGALFALIALLSFVSGCNNLTSPSPLDGIWLVESVENNSGLPMPKYASDADAVYWEFQNVLFQITYNTDTSSGLWVSSKMWGYPVFDRDSITFTPDKAYAGNAFFPVPGGENLTELKVRYETAHGHLTLYGRDYTIHLVRR